MTKVVFETATIADAIKKADRIAPSKGQAFDKAAGIVIEITAPGLPVVVRATNIEIFSMEWVDTISIDGPQTTWRLPAKLFAQVMATLPIGSGKEVTLEEKTNGHSSQVHLTSGKTRARFNLLDSSYYPEWSAFDPDNLHQVNDLGGRLAQVNWATSKVEVPINGVYLDGTMAVATDKYRLAVVPLVMPELKEPVTIPADILSQVLRQTGEVSIGQEGNFLLIMPDEHTQIKTVIYGEKFPGLTKVMRREYDDVVKIRKEEFLEILQRANTFAGSERIPSLEVYLGKGEIAVAMKNEEVGILGDRIEVPGYCDHDRHLVKFTPKNIIEAVQNVPNEHFELYYDRETKRSLIYIDGGTGYECWIMPRTDLTPGSA